MVGWRAVVLCTLLLAGGEWLIATGRPSPGPGPGPASGAPVEAARLMERSLASVRALRLEKRIPID